MPLHGRLGRGSYSALSTAGLLACHLQALGKRWLMGHWLDTRWTHWCGGWNWRQLRLSPGNKSRQYLPLKTELYEVCGIVRVIDQEPCQQQGGWTASDLQENSPRSPGHSSLPNPGASDPAGESSDNRRRSPPGSACPCSKPPTLPTALRGERWGLGRSGPAATAPSHIQGGTEEHLGLTHSLRVFFKIPVLQGIKLRLGKERSLA